VNGYVLCVTIGGPSVVKLTPQIFRTKAISDVHYSASGIYTDVSPVLLALCKIETTQLINNNE
jgi:hypothetical protein